MIPVFIDLHIHTSDDPNAWNTSYDLEVLKARVEEYADGAPYLLSLTDHNTINKPVYLKARRLFENLLLGVELHVRNYDGQAPYHCHAFFRLDSIDEETIDKLNTILDTLYPDKRPTKESDIPKLEDITKRFDMYDILLLPHGGQSHSTFDVSIPEGVDFDTTIERSIYYNLIDGFTARSSKGLDRTLQYFKRLGIRDFVNLVTSSDNYTPSDYPCAKEADATPFEPTWMLARPTFNGLRLSLSESSRLVYGEQPDSWAEHIQHVTLKNEHADIDAELTPGLNVVIGGSSSGKTLFVDSINRQILGNTNEGVYASTVYNVLNMTVVHPTGQHPHYFPQNYIVKVCDFRDQDNTIGDIDILKSVFPADNDERLAITNGLRDLGEHVRKLVEATQTIETVESKLTRLPVLSRLIVTKTIHDNPIRLLKPDPQALETIRYGRSQYDEHVRQLDSIETFLQKNPLITHDRTLILKLKSELERALKYSLFEQKVYDLIVQQVDSINRVQAEEDKETTTKRNQFQELLDMVKGYFRAHRQFYDAKDSIAKFSVLVQTKTIKSMGHMLYIDNEFKLTPNEVLRVINELLKSDYQIGLFEAICPQSLFKAKFKQRPKVDGYPDFIAKVNSKFDAMNRKKYRIVTSDGRDFDSLSAGWKTSVVLDLILGWEGDTAPLIIDQPEDNLATTYINSGLLRALKKSKSSRQVILVSHNATIPMLGDAQNVILCKNEGGVITIRSAPLEGEIHGTDVVDHVAEITDGGKVSVKKRVKKYNLKRFRGDNETNVPQER